MALGVRSASQKLRRLPCLLSFEKGLGFDKAFDSLETRRGWQWSLSLGVRSRSQKSPRLPCVLKFENGSDSLETRRGVDMVAKFGCSKLVRHCNRIAFLVF